MRRIRLYSAAVLISASVWGCKSPNAPQETTLPQISMGISAANPLDIKFNQPLDFAKLDTVHIQEATDKAIGFMKKSLADIYKVPADKRTFENTLLALDNASNRAQQIYGMVYLMANASPNAAVYEKANASNLRFEAYFNELSLDEQLYRAAKEYAATEEAKNLTGYKKKYLAETIRNFERSGFALPAEKREELKKLQNQLSELSTEFGRNIAQHKDSLILKEADLAGLPDDYKAARKTDKGYVIKLDYPSFNPFIRYADSEKARKDLYNKFLNRASNKNLDVLKQILTVRQQIATLLGYPTYAAYQVENRMAKTPQTVWDFENQLIEKVRPKAEKDYAELLEVKRAKSSQPSAAVVNPWESSYYNNILLKEKYSVDDEKIKEYFELNTVLSGLFKISQQLYGIEFAEVPGASVWHKDVKMYEVKEKGKVLGRFYLDLYPRENKYSHAACFPMIAGKQVGDTYQIPTASLLCNFPAPNADGQSLMPHGEVETFFHEFGHVLHSLLTTAELSAQSGTSVAQDFVEAPSQIYENWVWNYESLKLFAKHYKTGEVLPKDLFDKMWAAKNVGSGLATLQQVLYGTFDFTLHDKFDPNGKETTSDVYKRLQNQITLYPYLDGTHMEASFGHLTGYGAGYYGYMWSNVYAQDMFSLFEKNGVLDAETGRRYRNEVLAKGGTIDELEQVKNFLGREPNQDAFLKSIGLEVKETH